MFTLSSTGVLSPRDPGQVARIYSLRIGISGATTLGSNNTIIIALTSTINPDDTMSYAISVPLNAGPTIVAAAVANSVAAAATAAAAVATAEAQIVNAALPRLLRAATKITVDNISKRIDQALDAAGSSAASLNIGSSSNLQQLLNNNIHTALHSALDVKQMLNNSSFLIPLNIAGANNKGLNTMTLWGSGDYLSLADDQGNDVAAVDWKGEVIGASVGIDARLKPNLVAGAALAYSTSDIDYQRDDVNNNIHNSSNGSLSNTLYSVHPYLAYDLSQWRVWGILGYGQGELAINDTAASVTTPSKRDTRLYSLAIGVNRPLSSNANWLSIILGTTTLVFKGEVSLSNIKLDKSSELSASQALSINAHRYRMVLKLASNTP